MGRGCSAARFSLRPTPQEDLVIEDEHLLEELAPLKEALERAVHRKNEAEQLKDQLEDEVGVPSWQSKNAPEHRHPYAVLP